MKNNFVVLTFIFMVCISLSTFYYVNKSKEVALTFTTELNTLDSTIEANEKTIAGLKSDIEYHSSKEFIEKTAREKLGFVMPDEIVFVEK